MSSSIGDVTHSFPGHTREFQYYLKLQPPLKADLTAAASLVSQEGAVVFGAAHLLLAPLVPSFKMPEQGKNQANNNKSYYEISICCWSLTSEP